MANATVVRPKEHGHMCAMSLPLGKEVETDGSINAQIDGMTYCFANEDAKATFMKDPQGNLTKARAFQSSKS
jgi:YHS domain-containing protein